MKLLFILLDSVGIGGLLAVSFLYIILPIAVIIFLIYLFIKRKNKNK